MPPINPNQDVADSTVIDLALNASVVVLLERNQDVNNISKEMIANKL